MLVFPDGLASDYFTKQAGNKELLERMLSDAIGKSVEVTIQAMQDDRRFEDTYVDLESMINMEIEEEE